MGCLDAKSDFDPIFIHPVKRPSDVTEADMNAIEDVHKNEQNIIDRFTNQYV